MMGEAVVTRRPELFRRFDSLMKLHCALLAKGRILSLQFLALLADGLYYRIGRHADTLAARLKKGFQSRVYKIYTDSPTNQQFVVIPNDKIRELRKEVSFDFGDRKGRASRSCVS